MTVELKITYDGEAPGLQQHRLSLSLFAKPLEYLVAALHRTASAILANSEDDPEYGSRGGKVADLAKHLDLELRSIDEGCAQPVFVCTTRTIPGTTAHLPGLDSSLAEGAVERLVRDIGAESRGQRRNATARKYLHALPETVTRQRYQAIRDGVVIAEESFGIPTLREADPELPRLIKVTGDIASVGFEPYASFILLKVGARTIRCSATPVQVEAALPLRAGPVVAAVLTGEKPSLVWLRSAEATPQVPSAESMLDDLHRRWGRTLERLAR